MEKKKNSNALHLVCCAVLILGLMAVVAVPAMTQESFTDVSTWGALKSAAAGASADTPVYIKLAADMNNDEAPLIIDAGQHVVLDVNGKTISRGEDAAPGKGHVIEVADGGQLTLRDSSAEQTGAIIGSGGEDGVKVDDGGSYTREDSAETSASAMAAGALEQAKNDFYTDGDEDVPATSEVPTPTPVIKPAQTISAPDVNAVYGDTGVKIEAVVTTPKTGGGALSYTVKEGDAVSVDKTTGELTIHHVGEAVITVTAAETASYRRTTKNVNVTIVRGEQTAPDQPEALRIRSHDITILARPGEEYSIDEGETWVAPKAGEDNVVYDNLEANKEYAIVARMAETENLNPSPASESLVIVTPLGSVKSEIVIGDNLPNCTATGFDDDLAKQLCTPEDIEAVDNGEKIVFTLKISRLDNPPAGDKTLCDNAAAAIGDGTKVGMYLDVSITKKVGEAEPVAITDLNGNMITVAFDIPEQLRQVSANTQRAFYIIRVHEGVAAPIPATVQGNRISFESDLFSTYALAYQDTVTPSGGASGQNQGKNTAGQGSKGITNRSAKTGIDGNNNLYLALAIAGTALVIGGAAFAFRRRKGKQQ